MKRLKLANFKVQKLATVQTKEVDLLLGQILGDCHGLSCRKTHPTPSKTRIIIGTPSN